MVEAIVREIELTEPFEGNETIQTVYVGGGTPSLMNEEEVQKIFIALNKKFNIDNNAEITLEANPDDINADKLQFWRMTGITRLSIGIQTFDNEELKWMNRAHGAMQSYQCIDLALNAGFNNFSVDLIYGSPLINDEQWIKNIEYVVGKNIPHISAYALTIEPKTALNQMIITGKSPAVDHEKQARQFLMLIKALDSAGYEHYEISNFAKPGMRSRHNSSYWKNKRYYGFGPAAHSFNGISRRWSIANNAMYIQALKQNKIPFEEEVLTQEQRLNEYIMTSLRTMEGLDLRLVAESFGVNARKRIEKNASKWADKIYLNDWHLTLSNEGKLFADGIAADLFV
jgi:oxygen-independent coproporphyrinogen-3 oxidase